MKKAIQSAVIFSALTSSIYGFDYKVNGQVQNWSKFGFNNDKINTTEGKYPTDSFSVLTASLGINLDLGAGFSAGATGTIGGIVFDNTRFQGDGNIIYNPNGLAYNYFGFWPGKDYRSPSTARTTRNYVLQNLYIGYTYDKYIEAKIGRFSVPGDWLSGYIQGVSLQSYAVPYTRIWAFTTVKRASVGGKWLKDFKYMNQNIPVDNGKGFYVYAAGADFKRDNFIAQGYLYAQDSRFIAPGFHLGYDTNPEFKSEGFRSKTEILFLYMRVVGPALSKNTAYNNYDARINPDSQVVGKGGESLMIRQRFDIGKYNIGAILYKNFGNPNEFLTPYGDPIGFDNYDNTVYDSAAWNNIFRRDAISGFLFGGGTYTKLSWMVIGRITYSKRADEQAVAVNVDYKFPWNITAGVKVEWYNNTTFAGYTLGSGKATTILNKTISQDRSYASTYISYNF
ncbi:outer membrane family protein [Helicobacter cappadocius]|uniref:Outer membrane family protein n=1 Tax=Helicobacter cappadocius TaxID=3063998 RepID=A0AA90PM10_9HELI|nr:MULTISPECIES: outer membrane family protein [unclassified Helicobacter]MDO7253678.1 outer membrane family protein [Helicobacter sp. faydin-H75]MDP2539634.1 outer membrane family protein [Helicobacter sp. faydin-H76]